MSDAVKVEHCSFCGLPEASVAILITKGEVAICNQCIANAVYTISETLKKEQST